MNGQNGSNKTIYDCIDPSPFYENSGESYLDENDLIDIASDDQNPDFRKYPYGQNISSTQNTNARGMKVNRFYQKLKPYYLKQQKNDATLIFESRFESGNLRRAVQVGENEYDLILKYDYGTSNYTQWYYFKVSNTQKDTTYKFNIINLIKPESSYNQGMRPLLYSKKESESEACIGWQREGQNISYFQNSMKKKGGGFYHTLTF